MGMCLLGTGDGHGVGSRESLLSRVRLEDELWGVMGLERVMVAMMAPVKRPSTGKTKDVAELKEKSEYFADLFVRFISKKIMVLVF